MIQPPTNDLKQIKWILAGILACLVVITLAIAPEMAALILLFAIVLLAAWAITHFSETARGIFLYWKSAPPKASDEHPDQP